MIKRFKSAREERRRWPSGLVRECASMCTCVWCPTITGDSAPFHRTAGVFGTNRPDRNKARGASLQSGALVRTGPGRVSPPTDRQVNSQNLGRYSQPLLAFFASVLARDAKLSARKQPTNGPRNVSYSAHLLTRRHQRSECGMDAWDWCSDGVFFS